MIVGRSSEESARIVNRVMAKREFDWAEIMERAGLGAPKTVYLSSTTQEILLDALAQALQSWRWQDTTEFDDIEASVSNAIVEIQVEAMIGMIVYVAGSTPDNALYCDGAEYDRVDYPVLYERLDEQFILDANRFVVPDLRNLFVRGDGDNGIGDLVGSDEITLTVGQMPAHSHTSPPHTHSESGAIMNLDLEDIGVPDAGASAVPLTTGATAVSIDSTGDDEPHDNIPASYTLRPCIVAL